MSSEDILSYFSNLKNHVEGVPAQNIFNYDETNLTDDPGIKSCVFKRGTKYPERVRDNSKSSISIMYAGSAAGAMLPSYVVYKAENLWSTWMEGGPRGTRYNRTRSDWFDVTCFTDWFEILFLPCIKGVPGRKVLIGDNLSSHFTKRVLQLAKDKEVDFCCLPPNSTHLLQPLDVAFFAPLKKAWRKILDSWKSSNSSSCTTLSKIAFPGLLKQLHEQLFAGGHSENLESGFKACGIYPFDPKQVLKKLPDYECGSEEVSKNVSDAMLDVLKSMRGVDKITERRRKRRKVTVTPGKGVTPEDMESSSEDTDTEVVLDDESECSSESETNDSDETSVSIDVDPIESNLSGRGAGSGSAISGVTKTSKQATNDGEGCSKSYTSAVSTNAAVNISLGDIVIVDYEGAHFPGKVTEVDDDGAKVSTLTKCRKGWKWPECVDEIDYTWDKIVKNHVKLVTINNRGYFKVPDLEKEWGI